MRRRSYNWRTLLLNKRVARPIFEAIPERNGNCWPGGETIFLTDIGTKTDKRHFGDEKVINIYIDMAQ